MSGNTFLQGSIPRFSGENLEKNKTHYAAIVVLSVKYSCTPSQLALAWLLHQGDDIVPIPGMSFPFPYDSLFLQVFLT